MVIVRIWEGLGNQFFQYAYARALELRTGQRVFLDVERCFTKELEGKRTPREYQLDNFCTKVRTYSKTEKLFFFFGQRNAFERILFWSAQKKIFPLRYIVEKDVSYKKVLERISGCCYLTGWFQNEDYFKEYREVILRELRPRERICISSELKTILKMDDTVSVHVRRGDYKKANNLLPMSYYERAVGIIKEKIGNPVFLVFSDDIQWVKEHLNLGGNAFYVTKEEQLKDYEELLVMSKCKHNIIANSTFSWWGAWLNENKNKIVIGPRKWFSINGPNANYNIMPVDWIKV